MMMMFYTRLIGVGFLSLSEFVNRAPGQVRPRWIVVGDLGMRGGRQKG